MSGEGLTTGFAREEAIGQHAQGEQMLNDNDNDINSHITTTNNTDTTNNDNGNNDTNHHTHSINTLAASTSQASGFEPGLCTPRSRHMCRFHECSTSSRGFSRE